MFLFVIFSGALFVIEMVRVNVFDVIQYGYKFSLLSGKNVYWLSNARYISSCGT